MQNSEFNHLSESEKRAKFRRILIKKTSDRLLLTELNTIVSSVPMFRQYAIRLYRKEETYSAGLMSEHSDCIRTVLRYQSADNAAAFISWKPEDPSGIRILHIYIPPKRQKKGIYFDVQQGISTPDGL